MTSLKEGRKDHHSQDNLGEFGNGRTTSRKDVGKVKKVLRESWIAICVLLLIAGWLSSLALFADKTAAPAHHSDIETSPPKTEEDPLDKMYREMHDVYSLEVEEAPDTPSIEEGDE